MSPAWRAWRSSPRPCRSSTAAKTRTRARRSALVAHPHRELESAWAPWPPSPSGASICRRRRARPERWETQEAAACRQLGGGTRGHSDHRWGLPGRAGHVLVKPLNPMSRVLPAPRSPERAARAPSRSPWCWPRAASAPGRSRTRPRPGKRARGRRGREGGRLQGCDRQLEKAEALYHAPPHLQHLARCYEKVGGLVSAADLAPTSRPRWCPRARPSSSRRP